MHLFSRSTKALTIFLQFHRNSLIKWRYYMEQIDKSIGLRKELEQLSPITLSKVYRQHDV